MKNKEIYLIFTQAHDEEKELSAITGSIQEAIVFCEEYIQTCKMVGYSATCWYEGYQLEDGIIWIRDNE